MTRKLVMPALLITLLAACGKTEESKPAAVPPAATAPASPATATAPAATEPAKDAAPAAAATPAPATGTAASAADGAAVYGKACAACHGTGLAGAPKFADKAQWEKRIAQGKDQLYAHAIQGFKGTTGLMPPKGGNASLKDEEVKAAVDHMVGAVK